MNKPPDLNYDAPPSPAAFCNISASNEELTRVSRKSNKKNKKKKTRSPVQLRSRSRSRSSIDGSSSSFMESDTPLQAGQSTPNTSFSTIKSGNVSPPVYLQTSAPVPSSNPTQSQEDPPVSQVGRLLYNKSDRGPFIVHVQRTESTQSLGTTLHPVTFGHFLFSRSREFSGIVDGSIKSVGRNKISMNFHTQEDANNFIQSNLLSKHQLKAFLPTFSVTKMGISRGIPTDLSPEEIVNIIKVPVGCGPVIKIRRLNFKVMVDGSPVWKPSQTVVLTFDGQVLPSKIFMYYNAIPVELYTFPTIQCFNCSRFGHTKAQCRSKPRCFKCGQNHPGESCKVEEDSAFCLSCSGCHYATNKKCPEYDRQKSIKKKMAEESISYVEASKAHAPSKKSFAEVTASAPPSPSSSSFSYKKTVLFASEKLRTCR